MQLADKHLVNGSLVLYDLTSSYFEGRHCRLVTFGHSRDERPGNPQIVYGLLTDAQGCPVAVEIFRANTADPNTVKDQIADYPGERLIACRNPLLAEERVRKRKELLEATKKELNKVLAASQRAKRPFRGKERIALRVGKVLGRYKIGKHFRCQFQDNSFTFERIHSSIDPEAALDGIYVIRTNVAAAQASAADAVRYYKELSNVERAFRSLKSVDLQIRPIHHRTADSLVTGKSASFS